MIFLNPLAWFGALLIGIPVAVHLLARRDAQRMRFPTVRFLRSETLVRRARARLTDIPLLFIRVGIVAAAVAALAHPLLVTESRREVWRSQVARAIIVDSSASMLATSGSTSPFDSAVVAVRGLDASDGASRTVHSADPLAEIASAVEWLQSQRGRRELVVISDFRFPPAHTSPLTRVPHGIGVRLIPVRSGSQPGTLTVRSASVMTEVRMEREGVTTTGRWSARPFVGEPVEATAAMRYLTAPSDSALAVATLEAAREAITLPLAASPRPVLLVHTLHPAFEELFAGAERLSEPWMGELIADLSGDTLLLAAAGARHPYPDAAGAAGELPAPDGNTIPIRTSGGEVLALVAAVSTGGVAHLAFFMNAPPGTLAAAALAAGVLRHSAPLTVPSELEPEALSDSVLRSLEKELSAQPQATSLDPGGPSDARWIWLLAVGLIALEWLVRRRASAEPTSENGA